MFEAPSAQPGDSPPRPHGLQQTLSLSLSWFMDRHHHTKSIKYTVKKCINIYIYTQYTHRYWYKIYVYIQNIYKPPRASNIHVKQCKHFAEDNFTKICWSSLHWRNGEQSYFNVRVRHGRAHKTPKPYSFPLRSQYQTLSSTWAPM